LNEFLAMGGYAAYVWSAFAIAFVLMVSLFLQSRQAARRRDQELEALRAKVRPQRPRVPQPMRPRREAKAGMPEPMRPGT
jgi:heme exporter protein D